MRLAQTISNLFDTNLDWTALLCPVWAPCGSGWERDANAMRDKSTKRQRLLQADFKWILVSQTYRALVTWYQTLLWSSNFSLLACFLRTFFFPHCNRLFKIASAKSSWVLRFFFHLVFESLTRHERERQAGLAVLGAFAIREQIYEQHFSSCTRCNQIP